MAGLIYFDEKSGTYVMGDVFTDLNSGSIDYSTYTKDLELNGSLGNHVASIHTHGTYGIGAENNSFSPGDQRFIRNSEFNVPLYMTSSNLQVISPTRPKPRVVRHRVKQ